MAVKKTSQRLMRRSIRSWINWKGKHQKQKGGTLDPVMGEFLKNMKRSSRWKGIGTEMNIGDAKYIRMPQI